MKSAILKSTLFAAGLISATAFAGDAPSLFNFDIAVSGKATSGSGSITTTTSGTTTSPTLQGWMSSEVGDAWAAGYKGQKVTIKVVDDFSGNLLSGNLNGTTTTQAHGAWTKLEASLIAPSATIATQDLTNYSNVSLARGMNVINMSYSLYAASSYTLNLADFSTRDKSLVSYAQNGNAVIVKAAGNDSVAMGAANSSGMRDYLNVALRGTTAIFVGALNKNGTTASPATLASYSNSAGTDAGYQSRFLTVGVDASQNGNLQGTSFAAPIISGYAAILGSKFTTATPTAIANQLLNTARTDTVANYNAAVYGRGEASLTRALAPVSIK